MRIEAGELVRHEGRVLRVWSLTEDGRVVVSDESGEVQCLGQVEAVVSDARDHLRLRLGAACLRARGVEVSWVLEVIERLGESLREGLCSDRAEEVDGALGWVEGMLRLTRG